MPSRKKDVLTVLEDAKTAAVPQILANMRAAASELVAQPAMSSKVPPEERRRQFAQRLAETEIALSEGQPEREGTLGALIREEQKRWGLDPNVIPVTVLDYITEMTKETD